MATCDAGCCPREVLDLFSGAGGAAMGLHRAWPHAHIVGVDVKPMPRYPFEHIVADAMTFPLEGYDFIWASPPCQRFTQMSARWRARGNTKANGHADLLTPTRARLWTARASWVIENVVGARDSMAHTLKLHGGMFGLAVHRPRLFESNRLLLGYYARQAPEPIGVYGTHFDSRRLWTRTDGSRLRAAASLNEAQQVMGIDWMEWRELKEAIPPAYSEYIARQLTPALTEAAA